MFSFLDLRRATWRHRRSVLGLGTLALLGLAAIPGRRDDLPDPIKVRREDLVLTVEVEGELAAVRSVEIGAPPVAETEFKIRFLAPEGSEVKKGQPVLGFDTEQLTRLLQQKQAELAEAQAKLDQKEVELRMKTLDLDQRGAQAEADLGKARLKAEVPAELEAGVELAKAQLDLASRQSGLTRLRAETEATLSSGRAQLRSLANQRDRARGRVQELEAAIARMTVLAPQDAIVIHKTDWRDEKKKVGDDVWRADTVLVLPDLAEMRADGTVDEADGGQVRVGQPVVLRLPARPDLDLGGKVQALGRTVRRKSWRVPAKVYKVEIALARTDPAVMRPAMRFRGEIEVGRLTRRLVLPTDAVFLREAGPVVLAKRGLGFREVAVRLGQRNRRQVEVLEGVTEGELILPQDLSIQAPRPQSAPAGGPS